MARPVVTVVDPPRPEQEARVIRPLDLVSHALEASGIARLPAITHELVGAEKLWVGVTILEPGATTGPHHHGDRETGVYMVAGRVLLRWGSRLEANAELEVGDLAFVPPHLSHEVVNPSPDKPAVLVVVWNGDHVSVPIGPDADDLHGQD